MVKVVGRPFDGLRDRVVMLLRSGGEFEDYAVHAEPLSCWSGAIVEDVA